MRAPAEVEFAPRVYVEADVLSTRTNLCAKIDSSKR